MLLIGEEGQRVIWASLYIYDFWAAQTTAGKCSQEEARLREATMRTQHKGKNVHREKTNKNRALA
jgi:hypothetical protein